MRVLGMSFNCCNCDLRNGEVFSGALACQGGRDSVSLFCQELTKRQSETPSI